MSRKPGKAPAGWATRLDYRLYLTFFQNETIKLTDTTTELLRYALGDIEEPFSAELEESAKSMTACLKNVLQSTSRLNNASGYSTENTITLTEKVW